MKKFKINVVSVKEENIDKAFNIVLQMLQVINQARNYIDEFTIEEDFYKKILNDAETILRELYIEIYKIKLTPLTPLFKKLQETAYRLARKLGKQVKVIVKGADVYIDKKIVEVLTDPLVHIVRNAIDHGIEEPSERIAKGKDPVGKIIIKASRNGPYLEITVEDDGRGIDSEKVIKKAVMKGILPRDKLKKYSWDDVVKALTTPGFSTKDRITEVSGRGVGLDVVKKKVEELRGKLLIKSEAGKGTKIYIVLPLTALVINCLVIKDREILFGIPINKVKYVIKKRSSQNHIIYQGRIMLLNRLLYNNARDRQGKYIVIVERNTNDSIALCIDDIIGKYSLVVKPLPPILSNNTLDAINGIALFRNNKIVFIIEPSKL